MRKQIPVLTAILLSANTLVWASDDSDQNEAQALRKQGAILPLEQIVNAAQQMHRGRIVEVDLEKKRGRYIYEIELVDSNGQVWEMKFDAKDATLISQEKDD